MRENKKIRSGKFANSPNTLNSNIYIIILTLFVIAIYGKTINFDFVNIDDGKLIYENPVVTNSSVSYSEAFTKNLFDVHYKPLVFLSWKAEHDIFGANAWHFHLFNWLLHLVNTILLFFIGIKLFERLFNNKTQLLFSAFLLALLFTINPLRIESVAWATERKDVLFAFFFLVSWLVYIHFIGNKNYLFVLFGSLLYLFSGLSKSMGITLLAVLFLTDFWYNRKFELKLVVEKLPFVAVFILLSFLFGLIYSPAQTTNTTDTIHATQEISQQISSLEFINNFPVLIQWILTTSVRFVLWFLHCLIPVRLSVIYPHETIFRFFGYSILMFPFIIAGLYFLGWKLRKKHLAFWGGLLFFGITLSPALALDSSGQGIFLSDRYTYIPSIGLFFLVVIFLNQFKYKSSKYNLILAAIILFYFSVSMKNVNHWKNSETLFTQVLKIHPKSGVAHLNLGQYYRTQNNINEALKTYNSGILNAPEYYQLYSNRGKIYFDQKQYDLAIADFDKCLSFMPDFSTAIVNRGAAYGIKQEYKKALADLNNALEIDPKNTNALSNRGLVYFQINEYEKSINDYLKYLEQDPNNPDILNVVGLSYYRLNKPDQAITRFNQAIILNNTNGAFYMNRSLALNTKGDKTNASNDAQKAQQLGYNVNQDYMDFLKQ